jgi:hypothetical protein
MEEKTDWRDGPMAEIYEGRKTVEKEGREAVLPLFNIQCLPNYIDL